MSNLGPTARELEVFETICRWGCDKDAATALGISMHTVRGHMARLQCKLGAHNRLEVAMVLGWLLLPPATHGHSTNSGIAARG